MANPRKPLRLNVGFIINAPIGTSRDFDFDIPKLKDDDILITGVQGVARVGRTPQGLLVQANFAGKTALMCVRCLTEFIQPISWEFTDLYAFKPENVTESELLVPDDAHIDLQPLVREYALLEIPLKPLCREDCQGLCIECGQNLNEKDCGHSQESDSPFMTLKSLLEKNAGEEESQS